MMILPIISNVLMWVDVEPWFMVTYSSGLITTVLGFPSELHGPGAEGIASFQPDFYTGLMVMVAYTIIFFLVSIIIANRKKME
ncbi:MAG: hypothetical protein KAJ51_10270 [Thermoplasmata archaeon]|nr:hypothetical protein [Thermoplasmata archaeon]